MAVDEATRRRIAAEAGSPRFWDETEGAASALAGAASEVLGLRRAREQQTGAEGERA